jgi:hypothetical protein
MDEYEWKQQYLERLTDLGLSQTEAVSVMQHRFGRRPIDTDNCPGCAADTDELARLRVENAELRAKATKYETMLFALGAMDKPPCFCCGYNGSGYYQPDEHPCAARHHDT